MPCLYFHPDAYTTKGRKVMGRHVAGESFLKGYLNHGKCDDFAIQVEADKHSEIFNQFLVECGKNLPYKAYDRLSASTDQFYKGVVFYPGPGLAEWSKFRSFAGDSLWSICGVTHTISSHGAMDSIANLVSSPVQPWDALVCTSYAVKKSVEEMLASQIDYLRHRLKATQFPLPQLPVIPLGIETKKFAPPSPDEKQRLREIFGIGANEIVCLFVGRLSFHAKANPCAMYKAIEEAAAQSGKAVVLLECGWFYNSHIEESFSEARRLFCPSVRTIFVDGLDPESAKAAWSAADIFCSLVDNIQETFGITPAEAMAAGLPVVVSDWNGYKDTVRDGVDGFRVPTLAPSSAPPQSLHRAYAAGQIDYDSYLGLTSLQVSIDHRKLVQALRLLFASRELRFEMSENALKRAQDVYDWANVIPRYEQLWADLDERRLAKQRSSLPSSALYPAPERPDPFHFFANYPTRSLGLDDKVKIVNDECVSRLIGRYTEIISLKMFSSYLPSILGISQVERLLALAESGHGSVESLSVSLEVELGLVMRTVAFLIKIGLLEKASV